MRPCGRSSKSGPRRSSTLIAITLVAWLIVPSSRGFAQDHVQTLAYLAKVTLATSPHIRSLKANQIALNEQTEQARAGWRPTIAAVGTLEADRQGVATGQENQLTAAPNGSLITSGAGSSFFYNASSATIQIIQPVFTGGRIAAAVLAADANASNGAENLGESIEQTLGQVVSVYAAVIRDKDTIALQNANVMLSQVEVDQALSKYQLGQSTKIDVSQAKAQYYSAKASLSAAVYQATSDAAQFTEVTGQEPGKLERGVLLQHVPETLEEAIALSKRSSFLIKAAESSLQSAKAKQEAAVAQRRPTLSLNISAGAIGQAYPVNAGNYSNDIAATLTLNQTIYAGGAFRSAVRQAADAELAAADALEDTERTVEAGVRQAWAALASARESVTFLDSQTQAADAAFRGLQAQNQAGVSSTQDLINQQMIYINSRLAFIQAEGDLISSESSLLQSCGILYYSLFGEANKVEQEAADSQAQLHRTNFVVTEVVPEEVDRLLDRTR